MNEIKKIKDMFIKLGFILSQKQKKYAVLVFVMGLFAALFEMLGVAVIIPIMDMLLNMNAVRNKWYMIPFVKLFNLNTDVKLTWFICLGVVGIYLLKNIYFIIYNWVSFKYSAKVQRELSVRILNAYMKQGYIFFVENNTARLMQGITNDVSSVYQIVKTIFALATKAMTIICIGFFIVVQSRDIAIILIMLVLVCFIVIQLLFRKSMQSNGRLRRKLDGICLKTSIEAIQGNKEILVMHKQDFFVKQYEKMLARRNRVAVKVDLGDVSPAFIIEMVCICGVILAIAVQIGSTDNVYDLINQLSTIAIGAFRILPALGGMASGINSITANTTQLSAAYETLEKVKGLEYKDKNAEKNRAKYKNISFNSEIEIKNINFQYPGTENYVLESVNFKIRKGEAIGLIGASGAGKTTLSDIILGLLKPSKGNILLDGIDIEDLGGEWNRIIGYVPQNLYIVDDTIKHNIAFGEELGSVDDEMIWQALRIAQLEEFVKSLPKGIDTQVGEFGVRFSGGQRQRLAIARALYRNPEILILDEATAALDNETEMEVMKAIENLQGFKTLIIVAHRLTTVAKCDTIYEVKDKGIVKRSKEEVLSNV